MKRAFTLIELLVVITIIAILVSLLIPVLSKAKEEGRRAQCINNQKNLSLALQLFSDDNNYLPNNAYQSCDGSGKLLWVSGYYNHYACRTDSTNTDLLLNSQHAQFAPYIQIAAIYKCPSDRKMYKIDSDGRDGDKLQEFRKARSYSLNWQVGWMDRITGSGAPSKIIYKIDNIIMPSNFFTFIDVNSDSICWTFFGVKRDNIFMYPAIYHNKMSTVSFIDGHIISKKWKTLHILTPNIFGKTFHNHGENSSNNADLDWLMNNSQE